MGRKRKTYSHQTNNNDVNIVNNNIIVGDNNKNSNSNNILNYFNNNKSNNNDNNVKKRKRRTKKEIIKAKNQQQQLLLHNSNDNKNCTDREYLTNNSDLNIVNYWMEDYNNFKTPCLNNISNNKGILLQNCSIVKTTNNNNNNQEYIYNNKNLQKIPLVKENNVIIDKNNIVKVIDNLFDKIIPINNEIEYFKIMENNTNIINNSIKFEDNNNSLQLQTNNVNNDDVKNFSKYKIYNQNSFELCNHCKIPLLISIEYDSLYCKNCKHKYNISDNTMATVSFLDEVELQIFPYQKPGHALKWKNNILWRSKKVIHLNILHYIMQNLKSNLNLHSVKDIKCHHINYIVRKLKLDSLYQHTTQIFCRITGTPPPTIEKDVEENGDLMFLAIQEPFKKYKKPERKNLFSYPFIWYKIWESLGQYHLLDYLFLLSEKKLKEQSEFWEEICNDPSLNWTYIPTEIKNKYDYTNLVQINNK